MPNQHVPATNTTYISNIAFVVTHYPETNTTVIELMVPSNHGFLVGVLSSLTATALTWLFWLLVTAMQ